MDGEIDYRKYDDKQLCDIAQRIDAARFPKSFANLSAVLISRGIDPAEAVAGRIGLESAPRRIDEPRDPPASCQAALAYAPQQNLISWLGPSRNDFHLVGQGSIAVFPSRIVVRGRRYSVFFGLPLMRTVELASEQVFNVEREGAAVRFEVCAPGKTAKAVAFWLADSTAAEQLVAHLPIARTEDFTAQLAAHVEFERRLLAQAPQFPVTLVLLAANALMFLIALINGAAWFDHSGDVLLALGSNFGPSTTDGQWWRLFTALFLHFGVLHLAFNMWALISFGAVVERLFGSVSYAAIYLLSGVMGSLASVAWYPAVNSVGASGAIFGIIGALLAAQMRRADSVPGSVRRAIRNSTLVFVICAGGAGLLVPGIDNAAHVGGFVAGVLLGWVSWRELSGRPQALSSGPGVILKALAVAVPLLAFGYGVVRHTANNLSPDARFRQTFAWFSAGETNSLEALNSLSRRNANGVLDDRELSKRIESEILPFWRDADVRVNAIVLPATSPNTEVFDFLRTGITLRLEALETCALGLQNGDAKILEKCRDAQARVSQFNLDGRKRGFELK